MNYKEAKERLELSNEYDKVKDSFKKLLLGLLVTLLFLSLAGIPFTLVWNAVLPVAFNIPVITYWQSIGIIYLLTYIRPIPVSKALKAELEKKN